jgi:hypothetical protein
MPTPGSGGGGDSSAAAGADLTTINKINRARYLHVTDQARHLPIAVKLAVDQAHVHDVLTAFANSRLRMQITQVSLLHVRNVQRGSESAAGKDNKGKYDMPKGPSGGGSSLGPAPGVTGGNSPRGSGGGYGAPMPGGPGTKGGKAGAGPMGGDGRGDQPGEGADSAPLAQDTAQLVELTVYAIATLYERFPARPKPAEGSQPNQSGTPTKQP